MWHFWLSSAFNEMDDGWENHSPCQGSRGHGQNPDFEGLNQGEIAPELPPPDNQDLYAHLGLFHRRSPQCLDVGNPWQSLLWLLDGLDIWYFTYSKCSGMG